jgi:hypothetical protein
MLRRIIAPEPVPTSADLTVGELLERIAAADAHCHDDAFRRPLLEALAGTNASPDDAVVVLVRMLVARVRIDPALRSRPLAAR